MKIFVWFGFVLGALSAAGEVILTKPGQKATIKCGVNTYSSSLRWNHGNDLIMNVLVLPRGFESKEPGQSDTAKRSSVSGTKLVISPVKEEDAGTFICETDGNPQEHTLFVVSVSASPSAELQLGSEATLSCQVKGLNPGSTVQWKRPDGSASSGSQTVQFNFDRSGAGTWQCTFSHNGKTYGEDLEIKVQESAPETASPSKTSVDINKTSCPTLRVIQKMKNGRQPLKPKKYCQCDRPAAAAKPQQGRRREKPSAPPLPPLLMQ